MSFSPEETTACRRLMAMALEEDLGSAGDITSQAVIPADLEARTIFVARSPGVLAGLPAAALVMAAVDAALKFQPQVEDGSIVAAGDRLATLSGRMRSILSAERTALNFLQHLSGIATLTRRYVDAVAGLPCKILDTRKTIPGWRLLAKYAVRQGGGCNHRLGLFDGIMIKDNHLAALHGEPGALATGVPVIIEVENLDQLAKALVARPTIILLDNMEPTSLRRAVVYRNSHAPGILLEASGGVNLQNVRAIAETGVDRISVGALTHSAPALDIALDYGS